MKSKRLLKIMSLALLSTSIIAITPVDANAAWKQNSTGWWYTEGNSWATGWRNINGAWYFFDGNGYMKTGWVLDRGTWYFLNPSGAMATGWILDRGTWYYLQSSGAMKTGWLSYKGSWYFLKSSGAMASNEMIQDKNEKYYLEQSGVMATGWKEINSDKYYFNGSGAAVKGEYKIGNDSYYFNTDSCKLLRNGTVGNITTDKDGKILGKSEKKDLHVKYYIEGTAQCFDKDGNVQNGWIEIDGDKYYASENGFISFGVTTIDDKLYPFDAYGKLVTKEGLNDFRGSYFYVNKDGSVALGWKTINNKKYYFDKSGYALSGIAKVENNKTEYYFDCVTSELVCNADKFGISTDENGKLKKYIDEDALKSYILSNDSEEINKLKADKYKFELKYKKLDTLENVYGPKQGFVGTIYDENGKVKKDMDKEQVLTFSAVFTDNNGKEQERLYYISIEDGKIYTVARLEENTANKKYNLFEIKDNKVISRYDVTMYEI